MTQDEVRARVTIRIDELIIKLKDILSRVQWQSAIRMHDEVHDRLVCKKIWLALQFEKTANAN